MQNLQGIISRSVNNATMQFERLGQLTTNAANYNTYGYKSIRFENYLKENGRVDGVSRTDFTTGTLFNTGNDLDVALDGPGFIPVTNKDGQIAYTRNGSFKINKDGLIVTSDDAVVGTGIKIPQNTYKINIHPDGKVMAVMTANEPEKQIGSLPVVNFNNPEALELADGNKLLETKESGPAYLVKNSNYVKQNCLERSNVDLFNTVGDVMRLNAGIIASTRLLKFTDDIYNKSINLKQ